MTCLRAKSAWRTSRVTVAWFAMTLTLGACGGTSGTASPSSGNSSWDKVVTAARSEGTVTVYMASPTPVEKLAAAFQTAYPGITPQFIRIGTNSAFTKIEAERDQHLSGADLWITDAGFRPWLEGEFKSQGLVAPVGPNAITWPAQYGADSIFTIGRDIQVIPYNSTLVKPALKGYVDMINPAYDGKIGVLTPLSVDSLAVWADWVAKQFGWSYWSSLAKLHPRFYTSSGPMLQAIASGEIWMCDYSIIGIVQPVIDSGAPVAMAIPNPSLGVDYQASIFSWAQHPNAAQVVMNWLLSRDAQSIWHSQGSASVLSGIKGAADPSKVTVIDIGTSYTPAQIVAIKTQWNSIFGH